jgi:FlaA1/EpsC-like NDP-sugar epimerase
MPSQSTDVIRSLAYLTPTPSLTASRRLALFLLISDLLGIFLFLILTYFVRIGQPLNLFNPALSGTAILILTGFYIADAYRPDLRVAQLWAPARVLISCLLVGVVLAALSYLFRAAALTPLLWRSVLLPGLGLFTLWAVLLRLLASAWAHTRAKQSACLLLGSDDSALQFERDFMAWNPLGKLVVLADTAHSSTALGDRFQNLAGSLHDLPLATSRTWSGVVVTPQVELSTQQVQHLMQLRLKGTSVYKLPDFYEMLWQKLPPILLQDTWFAFGGGFHLVANRINLKIKRLVDILIATFLLIILLPIMLLTVLAVKLETLLDL